MVMENEFSEINTQINHISNNKRMKTDKQTMQSYLRRNKQNKEDLNNKRMETDKQTMQSYLRRNQQNKEDLAIQSNPILSYPILRIKIY
jgi:hypothetical protein